MSIDWLGEEKLSVLKQYCKIDNDFEDELLEVLIQGAAEEIVNAIDENAKPSDFINDTRFFLAVMKTVKEDYELRGLTANGTRNELPNGVVGIINQLRGGRNDGHILDE